MSTVETNKLSSPDEQALFAAAAELEGKSPQDILRWAALRYRPGVSLACSFGMQSVVIIDMLDRLNLLRDVDVFYLDTGVLFAETHQTRLRLAQRYDIQPVRVAPKLSWDDQQAEHGGHLYERGEKGVHQCCHIRKVEPLRKHLADRSAWITGLRRGHARNREEIPVVLWDLINSLPKINPLAAWTDEQTWAYIKEHEVPYNPLYDQGYASIGCNTPVCTQPVAEGEDPRSGRWQELSKTECGIHLDGRAIKSLDSAQL